MAVYTIHAGHAAHGKRNCGAVGFCAESLVDRQIARTTKLWLEKEGHTVYDCTVDEGITASAIISNIKKKINSHKNATANISIHLNASKTSKEDFKIKGSECLVYSTLGDDAIMAKRILRELTYIGFPSRGVKRRTDLGVLKGINNGGLNILVEVFFCDDEDDYFLYKRLGADVIGKAIAQGILGRVISNKSTNSYMHDGIDYSHVFNPTYYEQHNSDLKKYAGNSTKLFEHFLAFGMKEGREASADFNVKAYKERYPDLKDKFKNEWPLYYKHFCLKGYSEGRKGI